MDVKSDMSWFSISGPLHFSIYINDIVTVSKKFKFLMYADDMTIGFNLEDLSGIIVGKMCQINVTKRIMLKHR